MATSLNDPGPAARRIGGTFPMAYAWLLHGLPIAHWASPPHLLARGASHAEPILRTLKGLESRGDPKCHWTFCRFEDFLDGTRALDIEMQKALGHFTRHLLEETASRAWENAGGCLPG